MKIDAGAPNLVSDRDGFVIGVATKWNPCGVQEVIVQFFDGSASSIWFSDLLFPNGVELAIKYLNDKEL